MFRILALLALCVATLRAHDLYTSWTDAYLRADRLELTLTLARASALRLIPGAHALPPITPENFADYAPQLQAIAPLIFEITSADKPLKLTAATSAISGDNDVTFRLRYSRPTAGPLRFVGRYLLRQIDGHVGTIVVMTDESKDLGWSPISVDQPVFEITNVPVAVTPGTKRNE